MSKYYSRLFKRINRLGHPKRYGVLFKFATEWWINEVSENYRAENSVRSKFKNSTQKLIQESLYDYEA